MAARCAPARTRQDSPRTPQPPIASTQASGVPIDRYASRHRRAHSRLADFTALTRRRAGPSLVSCGGTARPPGARGGARVQWDLSAPGRGGGEAPPTLRCAVNRCVRARSTAAVQSGKSGGVGANGVYCIGSRAIAPAPADDRRLKRNPKLQCTRSVRQIWRHFALLASSC